MTAEPYHPEYRPPPPLVSWFSDPRANNLWHFLNDPSRIAAMRDATADGRAAIAPLLGEIEEKFGDFLSSAPEPSEQTAVLCNNMVKQIMEREGYRHLACGLLPQSRWIKVSGVYEANNGKTRKTP